MAANQIQQSFSFRLINVVVPGAQQAHNGFGRLVGSGYLSK
jgi:hypothetical protein